LDGKMVIDLSSKIIRIEIWQLMYYMLEIIMVLH
jgi:hypothetical protein